MYGCHIIYETKVNSGHNTRVAEQMRKGIINGKGQKCKMFKIHIRGGVEHWNSKREVRTHGKYMI